ncbi:hypothetical protein DB346_19595, partial [Verrucomicrobia bacterium LW23]
MSTTLEGKYYYRSFRSIQVVDMKTQGSPSISSPWSPTASIDFSTDTDGIVSGKLLLDTPAGQIVGTVTGKIDTSKIPGLVAEIELELVVAKSVNKAKGYLVKGTTAFVGGILEAVDIHLSQSMEAAMRTKE